MPCMLPDIALDSDLENIEPIYLTIPNESAGLRIDAAIALLTPELSRTRLTTWLKEGRILVNNKILRPKDKIYGGEEIIINPVPGEESFAHMPEDIDISVVFEDEHVIVINKPAGLIVHPGAGNWNGTLLNALLFHYPELKNIPRAGIVHRLDKDTSGLMVVARTLIAQTKLVQDLEARKVTRIYRAIVEGQPHKEGIIKKNVGRDPHNRIKMATLNLGGKEAITKFRVLQYFDKFSYIECKLETGRTHQIRVHLKSIGHPLVGDATYNTRKVNYKENILDAIESLDRQALHAIKLSFSHPVTSDIMSFQIPLAQDIKYLLLQLNENKQTLLDELDEDCDESNWEVFYVKDE